MTVLRPASPVLVRRLALASLAANVGIVVTGGAVRLTSSGLGCPTWPRCTDESYVPVRAAAGHALIEFGNRTLTFVIGVVTLATLAAALLARPRRPAVRRLAGALFLGVPAQAVLGGITVRTGLNPWTVMAHFLLSMALIAVAVLLWQRSRESADGPAEPAVRREALLLGRLVVACAAVTLALGTVVTGSGPHAGDGKAARTGFDPAVVAPLHADAVMLLIGLSVGAWLTLRATSAPPVARRAAAGLVGLEAAQGLIGYAQYFTHLPALLVGAHMLGASLVWVAALRLLLAMRTRRGRPTPGQPAPDPATPDRASQEAVALSAPA